jgi:hypothetical protein
MADAVRGKKIAIRVAVSARWQCSVTRGRQLAPPVGGNVWCRLPRTGVRAVHSKLQQSRCQPVPAWRNSCSWAFHGTDRVYDDGDPVHCVWFCGNSGRAVGRLSHFEPRRSICAHRRATASERAGACGVTGYRVGIPLLMLGTVGIIAALRTDPTPERDRH